jgi:hypothetical protein
VCTGVADSTTLVGETVIVGVPVGNISGITVGDLWIIVGVLSSTGAGVGSRFEISGVVLQLTSETIKAHNVKK